MKSPLLVLLLTEHLLLLLLLVQPLHSFQPYHHHLPNLRPTVRRRQQQQQQRLLGRQRLEDDNALCLSTNTQDGTSDRARKAKDSVVVKPKIRKAKPQNKKKKNVKKDDTQSQQQRQHNTTPSTNDPSTTETWRIYSISVHPDELTSADDDDINNDHHSSTSSPKLPVALQKAIESKLKLSTTTIGSDDEDNNSNNNNNSHIQKVQIVRRSLDARKKLDHPVYNYVVDITLPASQRHALGWRNKPGRMERLEAEAEEDVLDTTDKKVAAATTANFGNASSDPKITPKKKDVVIVGMGPAGLFCALQLALKSNNTIRPILLDRGQPVEKRGRDIGALMHRRSLDSESNFAFGEGGAGTWSDGKLTTRIGRNSETVRWVLELLVEFGAPSNILWEGAPHLGTDNLVRLLRNMRHRLEELGGEIHFGTKMTDLKMKDGKVCGVMAQDGEGKERCFEGDSYVLATGHSARDVYESLHGAGVHLEAKGFAVGFRIEHPQSRINMIQYGTEWGACVKTGKGKTDSINKDFFGVLPEHTGMPVPSYRLATDKAEDGTGRTRGVYSFCMCPGGQIVPSSTDPGEVCVNGMSFSRRDSLWANSALVVTVSPDDDILKEYKEKYGVLAGLEFQREMERRASKLGGGNLTVPVQRMTDFCDGKVSSTIPTSSYRLGVKSAPCHEIYPEPVTAALRDALMNHFKHQMPGYYHRDGLLHAVETRTSSPLRISRDPSTLAAVGAENLYPSGEGAGFAGGIVSAAVDGVNVGESILDNLCGESRTGRAVRAKSVGFSY